MANRRRPNQKPEFLEDTFADLPVAEQAAMLRVLQGLHRQKVRNGAALADAEPKPAQGSLPIAGGKA